jgi:predicted aspartyl protease
VRLKLGLEDFTTGRAAYLDQSLTSHESTPKIFVKLQIPPLPETRLAQLDTGAAWTVLDSATAEELGLLECEGEEVRLKTKGGTFRGRLVRQALTLLADEGDHLEVEATVFVAPDWPYGSFLGYSGLLENIRIALDPGANHFYFGATGPG